MFATSNIPSLSGSTQITAPSHNQFLSFSNQLSSQYPIPSNLVPHDLFPPCFLPVQQPVLPPTHPQAYIYLSNPTTLQQWSNPTHAHAPSDFPPPPPHPVHLSQQYSVLPSHTNTTILHQNPSLSYEQQPLPSHSSCSPHLYHHRLSSQLFPLYSSTDPNSVTTATSHHSLNPPDVHSLPSQLQVLSMTTSSEKTPIPTQSDSTRHSASTPYHTEQSSNQQFVAPHHPRPSCTPNCDAYHSLAAPSPPATTPSGVTAPPSTPAHQHPLSPAMQRYVTYLKNFYKNKTTPVYDKEHSLLQVKAKYFINIALVHKEFSQYNIISDCDKNEMIMDRLHGHVDAIQHKKTELLICDICKKQDGDLARSVLVEGAPGVGKTTFAYELCKRWARGELLWECAAVLLIKLRDHRTRTAQNMYDLLYHPRPEVQQAVVDELIDQDGQGMLLILDGYDELTDSQKESTSVIQLIMSRELLCQSTLMVTSRPLATRTLHNNFVQSIDQHIEVLGFTEKNIEEYIQSACGDKPELVEDFNSYLSCHPFSSALMFNPLQCAIVTDLYRSHWESGDKGFAPKTLTELYTGLVHIMLLRYLTHHPVYEDKVQKIEDLSDLPEEVRQQLKAVTELATKGIRNQQYVFDEVNTNIPLETLGLIQKEEVVTSGIGISTSYNFLHLTLQEYLAAVNYSQQCSSPEQLSQLLTQDDLFPLNSFLQYYGKEREPALYSSATHWPVVLFVAGRTKLSGVPTNIFKTGLHDSDDYDDDDITAVKVSLLHLLYETQSPQLIQSTLVTSRKYLSVSGSSALDWFVIGYCIANSTSTWRVEIDSNDNPEYPAIDQLVMGLCLGPEECSGESKICSLHISGYWTENFRVMLQLQQFTKKVTEIKFVYDEQWEQYDSETIERKLLSEKLSACYPMLEELTIKDAESSYSASLLSFISQHSNIHNLRLNQCNLSSVAISSLLIHFLQSSNNRLHKLTLDDCNIQIPDHSNSVVIVNYQLKLISPTDTANFSLQITGSLYAINYILSQPHQFYANTLTILKVTIVRGTTDSPQIDTSLYPNLVTLEILSQSAEKTYLHSISHENNLCTLSLTRCHLSNECITSLIQSPNSRLHELTLDHCIIQIPDHINLAAISCYQLITFTSPTDTGNFSLEITSSLLAINYILSQPHQFYANTLKLYITAEEKNYTSLYDSILDAISQHSNLHTLSLNRYYLTSDTVRSLIHSLQSSHCGLQEVTLDDCISDHTHTTTTSSKLKLKSLDSGNVSLEFTGYCCDVSHWLSQLSSYTQLTELILHLKTRDSTAMDAFQEILLYHHMLDSLKISLDQSSIYASYIHVHLPLSIPQFIELEQNNLRNLSLSSCSLSSDVTRSLIHSLQSPHCKLYKLALHRCTTSLPEDTQQTTILMKINVALHSLDISWSVLNQLMSCINPFTKSLTELIIQVDNDTCTLGVEKILQEIPSNCPLLETLKIDCDFLISLPLSVPQFIGTQRNNLQTLSLNECHLSSDVTRSLIHSLQSPHCKLYKLALYYCTIPTTDHTQLTTAIVSSTTITHLFFDINIDTPSLTALASGLKCNTTIEQLAVEKYIPYFTEDQFRVLIDAVDSSAVNKLWLNSFSDYKRWFSACKLSRSNIDIEWYSSYYYDLYNKW